MKIKILGFLTCSLVLLSSMAVLLRADHAADVRNEIIPPGFVMTPPWVKSRAVVPADGGPSGYTPQQMRHAYGFDQLNTTGQGQTIAIVDAYGSPTIQADLDTFCAAMGISSTTVKVYYPQGQPPTNSGWATETSLDVEWAHAIAPGATIVLVATQSNSDDDLYAGVDFAASTGATQVSMSWAGPEYSTETSSDFHFNVPGVSFFAASGDSGSNDESGVLGPNYPACSPYVVGVGGTTLTLGSSGNILSETAWSGSGGGISIYETLPSYQASWDSLSGSTRGVPDVAYDADPTPGVPVYMTGAGWQPIGGTSSATPQWAALSALANSLRSPSINSAPGVLYSLATADYAGYYHDIISGSNGAYSAGVGYDLVTGLGSPIANRLVIALAGGYSSQVVAPVFFPPAGTYPSGSAQNVTIVSATPGASIRYTTDGSTPTETYGTVYTGPIPISANTTLKAIAYESGLTDSPVSSGSYAFLPQVAAPTFNPPAGTYVNTQMVVTISTTTSGATIVYTTDGSMPTETYGTPYTGPITLSGIVTLQAIAYKSGYVDSPLAGGPYTISPISVICSLTFTGGYSPYGGVAQGTDGNFYGTTQVGGSGGDGTVFSTTLAGVEGDLASFTGANGNKPMAAVVQGKNGNFYGTTESGGASNDGTVFMMTPAGVLTTLVTFTGANGTSPAAPLIIGTDGNFYGTTASTVFKMTPAGVLTTLVNFTGANGTAPVAALLQASDGNFYGTTEYGGSASYGTIFKMTPAGALTTLYSFQGTPGTWPNGALPCGNLVQGSDGNFYGTTQAGGSGDNGTIFKMTPAGVLTTLISFYDDSDGGLILSGLVQARDGNFYGTTLGGGSENWGTVFRLTPAGILTSFPFTGANGNSPASTLVQGSDGNLYGTTAFGGPNGVGVVFQLAIPPQVAAPKFGPAGGTYTSAQSVTITDSTSGATIVYTTDGSTPTETNGKVYSGSLVISGSTTLQAFAYKTGYADSAVTSGAYTFSYVISSSNGFDNIPMPSSQAGTFTTTFDASPSLSPSNTTMALCKGTQTAYTGLSCIARFNTSGDIDAYNGTGYQAASTIPYSKALTYHFRMVVDVPANTYSVYVTPPGGSELTVGLNYKFRNAATSLDTWNIDVNKTPGGSVTVSNLAIGSGLQQVAAPVFSPPSGTYTDVQGVTITTATSGASIRFTSDGSLPTETNGTLYNAYTGPVPIVFSNTTLRAVAYKSGMLDSPVTAGFYVLQVAAPVFAPGPGSYATEQSVTITSVTSDATIFYTTDGSTPSEINSLVGVNGVSVPIATTTTLKAMAVVSGFSDSTVTSGLYTITESRVAAPVFSPPAGAYTSAQLVSISTTTTGASIRYTTDGVTIPTETVGTFYTGAVNLSTSATLNAIAYEAGMIDSPVTSGDYAITPVIVRYNFTASNNGGTNPNANLVQGSDGNFYGTTSGGGATDGTAFMMTPAGVLTTLVSFNGTNGFAPEAALVQGTDGNFYGTTDYAGTGTSGNVFKMTPAGALTTLVSFTGPNGVNPLGGLVQGTDGNFYGTTQGGGSAYDGTIFKMTPAGALTTLVSFTGLNGNLPVAGLVQGSDGNFYGTTEIGGSANFGTVFKMTPAGVLTTLVSFDDTTNGLYPAATLVQGGDGNFYGTTYGDGNGGTYSDGTVFKMTPAGTLTTLAIFNGSDGYSPLGLVQGRDGSFYGVTSGGGSGGNVTPDATRRPRSVGRPALLGGSGNDGTMFKITPAGALTTLVNFYGINGSSPNGLVQATDGNFYGTTYGGGGANDGVVFEVVQVAAPTFSPPAGVYTTAQSVTISTATTGASIRYTTDGVTTPTETVGMLYTGPISISTTTTLQAVAYKIGAIDSAVTTGIYTISQLPQVASPTFSPSAGTYTSALWVTITSATSGASIAYTTDGSTPTESGGTVTHGTLLSNGGSVTISVTTTLKSMAFKSGMADSTVTTGSYTINLPQVASPTFSPSAGTYTSALAVTITSATSGASIAYTTDGSTPTESGGTVTHGTLLSNGGSVTIGVTTTLKAMAFASGMADSQVTTGLYTINLPVLAPMFSPPAGAYQSVQSVTITSATSGTSIAYTTDGTTPTESGGAVTHGTLLANGGTVTVNTSLTIEAIAFKAGYPDSPVTSGNYAITPVIVRYNFTASNNGGVNPSANQVQGSDGNFYGTTAYGGSANDGTVFKVTPAGVLTNLVSFNGANGSTPMAALVQGSDGNFYGTTAYGGSANDGTVFKVTTAGVLTTFVAFTGTNGANPIGALVQGSDGNFYGTTSNGGSGSYGTVFKLTPAGVFTTLVSFTGPNGASPAAGLIQGSDGNFYGTTMGNVQAGGYGFGTVFKMTPAGALTTLVSFDSTTNGLYPAAALVPGRDGNFYGTTEGDGNGGTYSNGTVFRLTPAGVLTTLAIFNGSDGFSPLGMVQGSDGNFYGVTSGGGSGNDGTMFEITPTGVLATLDSFYGGNGSNPNGLVQGSDGNFYGTTYAGGTFNGGVIFEVLQVAAPVFSPAAGTYTGPVSVTITSATSGASIAYTTDGSTPTEVGGTITHGNALSNGGSVSIGTTCTLNALAFKIGQTDSTVTTGLYTITLPVLAPGFSPGAGTYTSPQTVTITSATPGASIAYTTDGSTPTEVGGAVTHGTLLSNGGSVSISTTTTLKALAFKTGMTDSTVTTGVYTINIVTRSLTGSSGDGFHALALTSAQSGTFTATFDATPTVSPENAVVGLSKGVATAYTGLSCIARFNTSGDIDAYNGTAYQAASTIPYTKNTAYHFRMVVNVPAHTYSVYVTPAGQSELTVGLNYAFRSTAVVSSLDTWNLDVNATPSGCSLTANNLNP